MHGEYTLHARSIREGLVDHSVNLVPTESLGTKQFMVTTWLFVHAHRI